MCHCAQTSVGNRLHHRVETPQHLFVHAIGGRLKVVPAQEEAHQIEAEPFDMRHIRANLAEVEALPHVHRATARPIVDAE
jgi:hypothetical protein